MMKTLKARAEDYTVDELLKLTPLNFYNPVLRDDIRGNKLLCIGERGHGKTFAIRYAIAQLNKQGYKPCMFVFKKNNVVEKIDYNYRTYDFIVYDDIHYLCESVLRGETDVAVLINLFKEILREIKKTILISDSPLCFYAEQLKNKEFNQLIMGLGEYVHSNTTDLRKVNFLAKEMFPMMSDNGIITIADDTGKKIDREILLFFLKAQLNPRDVVNFVNLFDSSITYETIIARMKNMVSEEQYAVLVDRKVVCDDPKIFKVISLARYFRDYSNLYRYIKDFNGRRQFIFKQMETDIERITKLYPEYTARYLKKTFLHLTNSLLEIKKEYYDYNISQDMSYTISSQKTLYAIDHWVLMDMYHKLLLKLKKIGKYSGDLSLFTGWKGNHYREWLDVRDLDWQERDFFWTFKKKMRCDDDCVKTCPFPVIKKHYEPKYREFSRIAEMRRVIVEGKYHYEK